MTVSVRSALPMRGQERRTHQEHPNGGELLSQKGLSGEMREGGGEGEQIQGRTDMAGERRRRGCEENDGEMEGREGEKDFVRRG